MPRPDPNEGLVQRMVRSDFLTAQTMFIPGLEKIPKILSVVIRIELVLARSWLGVKLGERRISEPSLGSSCTTFQRETGLFCRAAYKSPLAKSTPGKNQISRLPLL